MSAMSDLVRAVVKTSSTGELAMELVSRLPVGAAIRITKNGVRVTHSRYIDKLGSAAAVDAAMAANTWRN
jgi:hypothetical protein